MDSVTTNEAPEIKLHFLDYWRVIRLRRSLILVVFLLCVMTGTLLTIWLPKQYSSMVQIEVQKDDPEVAIAEAHQQMLSADPYFLTTQFKIIESYRILTNVINALHLNEELAKQNGSLTPWSIDETFEFLQRRLSVEQTRMTSLIEISMRNQDPAMAALIANQVAESYRKFRVDQWKESRGRGIEALKEKLETTTNDLQAAQDKLDKLRNTLHIDDIFDQSAMSLDLLSKSLEDWDHQRVMAKADYLEYSNVLAHLDMIPTNQLGGALQTAYAHQSDPELVELATTVRLARERMVDVAQNFGPEMPAYKTAKRQIEDSEIAYQNKIDAVMAGIAARVNEDKGLLQLYEQEEKEIMRRQQDEHQY
jgi:succinoglycan biosynthesis transport protein ExoP